MADSIWRNPAFVRVFGAATVSIFGSLVTRTALPFAAILVLGAGAGEVAAIRAFEIVGGVAIGLIAGAWIDRLPRRPVMIAADLGQAACLGSIPVAAIAGVLSISQLVVVAFLASILSTFHNIADNAYLPTVVEREQLVAANSALSASGSVAEVSAFSIGGVLVQVLSAPIAIAVDALSFLVSAAVLASIRRPEVRPTTREARRHIVAEIVDGLRPIGRSPILRTVIIAGSGAHLLWGAFGAVYLVFATEELGLGPATIGLIAAVGGISSLAGALIATRTTRRVGVGPAILLGLTAFTVGNALIPLAPAGSAMLAIAFLVGQQLIGDIGATLEEITELSLIQQVVPNEVLGRVNSTYDFLTHLALLAGTVGAGVIGEWFGLRQALFFGLLGGVAAIVFVWFSPLRTLRTVELVSPQRPLLPVEDVPLGE
ncbi:MAG TPA: MFS transporter [Candidatus Limnocylindrales bacterium]|nr:MFS transporter [Candidatus Limnocylindrales bacterium]